MEVPAPSAEDPRPALSARVCPPRRGCTVPGCKASAARRARAPFNAQDPAEGAGRGELRGAGPGRRRPRPRLPRPPPRGSPSRRRAPGAGRGRRDPSPRVPVLPDCGPDLRGPHLGPRGRSRPLAGPPRLRPEPRGAAPRRCCAEVNSILRGNRVMRPSARPRRGPVRWGPETDLEGDGDGTDGGREEVGAGRRRGGGRARRGGRRAEAGTGKTRYTEGDEDEGLRGKAGWTWGPGRDRAAEGAGAGVRGRQEMDAGGRGWTAARAAMRSGDRGHKTRAAGPDRHTQGAGSATRPGTDRGGAAAEGGGNKPAGSCHPRAG